jgi:hypothetical protein
VSVSVSVSVFAGLCVFPSLDMITLMIAHCCIHMQVAEMMARTFQLDKIMLTVIKENRAAVDFYKSKLKYQVCPKWLC